MGAEPDKTKAVATAANVDRGLPGQFGRFKSVDSSGDGPTSTESRGVVGFEGVILGVFSPRVGAVEAQCRAAR